MASIANDPGGRRRILFLDKGGNRKAIWLGKVSKRLAEEIKTKVERISTATIAGCSIDGETAEWLGKIGTALHDKLATAGLVMPREAPTPREQAGLGNFLESYIEGRTDVKPRTRINLDAARRRLVEYFGADKPIEEFKVGHVKDWVIWLKARYAKATIGRTVKRARQFFQAAIDKGVLHKNPVTKEIQKGLSQVNAERGFFVTLDMACKVLEACPDAEWRLLLLFALSRFGGLRCPSEQLVLKWADVDWERDRFRVVSSKTEHLEGGGVRWVPIFPELRPYLAEAFELAAEGAVYVITRYRDASSNLRTQLTRIIRRAGLEPWPKLWQNLRATRETELAEVYPVHVVCAWIGNTERIAAKHYLQVTEDHFALAAKTDSAKYSARNPKTAQNTAQHRARTEHAPNEKTPEIPGFSADLPAFSAIERYPQGDSNPCLLAENQTS